jgi:signal transduction histidine kinase
MLRHLLRDPRRLGRAFVGVMLVFTATLGWLGWQLIEQDRELEARRINDRRDTTADLVAVALDRQLSSLRQRLEAADPAVPADAIVVRFDRESVTPAANRLVYSPIENDAADDGSAAAPVAAAATARRAQRYSTALAAYARLEARGAVPVAGMPAALAARLGRLTMYESSGEATAAANEARALTRELDSARFPISFATYKNLADRARSVLPASERAMPLSEVLADAITWLWDEWSAGRLRGRWISRATPAGPVLLAWSATAQGGSALAASPAFVDREIVQQVLKSSSDDNTRVSIDAVDDGRTLFGEAPGPGDRTAIRLATATGLPWTIRAASSGTIDPITSQRRLILVGGLGLLVAFVLTGAWFVGRSVTRELEVARLKSDFVAAVSHEFRTPLTTVVQLSELLKRDRIASDTDRYAYYDLLHSEGNRLRRLVERLLNFGQVESGRAQYRMTPVPLAPVVESVVADFVTSQRSTSHDIRVGTDGDSLTVSVDTEALGTVLWNLLENAVKYSPDGGRVDVVVGRDGEWGEVRVIDEGVGIPKGELGPVFEPFVRGVFARERQICGTGVGLALSRSIVRAHGGDITVVSAPTAGSTFTIRLPRVLA